MPRGQLIRKKRVILDPKYKNPVVGKFVARMMEQGKKSISYSSIYSALDIIQQKVSGKEPLEVFQKALENVKPVVEVKSRRVGGATLRSPSRYGRSAATRLPCAGLLGSPGPATGGPWQRNWQQSSLTLSTIPGPR